MNKMDFKNNTNLYQVELVIWLVEGKKIVNYMIRFKYYIIFPPLH